MFVTYEAVDREGRTRAATLEVVDEGDAREQLRRQGLYVTRLETDPAGRIRALAPWSNRRGRLPLRTLTQFTKQLAMLLRAGSGLVPALTAISKQMKNPRHSAIVNDVIDELEDGQPLAEALQSHPNTFGPVYTAIIAAGEASGALTEMLDRLSGIVGRARALRKKIIGALAYPAVLVVMCLAIVNVLLFFVVPRFNVMFTQLGVETPGITKALLSVGETLQSRWPLVVAGVVLLGFLLTFLALSRSGKQWLADVQFRIPLVGWLRCQLILAQVLRTMGVLIESRVEILGAIELARGSTRSRRFQALFDAIEECVTSGQRMSTAFERSVVAEPALCQAIHTGEDSGNLGESMLYCADMADENNEELITIAMRLVEPLILIGMGFVVGMVALALFVPLFDITSAIR